MKSFSEFVKEKELSKVNESINMRRRSKIVSELKRNGIENNIDYTFTGGEFLASDMESAKDIADALAGKFKVTIYDNRKTRDGEVPVMITESNDDMPETVSDVNTNVQVDSERMERIKDNLALIKKDLEKSGESIQKIKKVIQNNEIDVSEKNSAIVTLEKLLSYQKRLQSQEKLLEQSLNDLKL